MALLQGTEIVQIIELSEPEESVEAPVPLEAVEEQELPTTIALQDRLDFRRRSSGGFQIPFWCEARMYKGEVQLLVVMQQRSVSEPIEQLVAVGCIKNIVQGVLAAQSLGKLRHGKKVKIVVAQDGYGIIFKAANKS